MRRGDKTRAALTEFHTRHKLLILAHSPDIYRQMGRLVAQAAEIPEKDLFDRYIALLMKGMRIKTTVARNTNVLQHILGYFKKQLAPDEKQEILEVIENYRQKNLPLIVPVTLLNHFVRKYGQPYLKKQYYLCPHPLELQLRNHV